MNNTYITALIDSLNKKIDVLNEIHVKDEKQLELTKTTPFPFDEYDVVAEEKTVLIYKLTKLDEGFELVYNKVKEELDANKDSYKEEIKTLQGLIQRITDLSVKIQAEEARNKSALEVAFREERNKLKASRSSVKAVKSYTQTMRANAGIYDGSLDNKK